MDTYASLISSIAEQFTQQYIEIMCHYHTSTYQHSIIQIRFSQHTISYVCHLTWVGFSCMCTTNRHQQYGGESCSLSIVLLCFGSEKQQTSQHHVMQYM